MFPYDSDDSGDRYSDMEAARKAREAKTAELASAIMPPGIAGIVAGYAALAGCLARETREIAAWREVEGVEVLAADHRRVAEYWSAREVEANAALARHHDAQRDAEVMDLSRLFPARERAA